MSRLRDLQGPKAGRRASFIETFSSLPINATKFLSSQTPQFGGTEEENVEIWIEKIESVAKIHGFSQGVLLSVAVTRLVKTARRWYDYNTRIINISWTIFKTAIINRFRREVYYDVILKKADARKWLFYKESFSDYAMDKITIMQPLKLLDKEITY